MNFQCEAVLLKTLPFKEHDLILKTYTPEKGITALFYRGGQSNKRRSGDPLSPLTHLELTYTESENSTLLSLKEFAIIQPFEGLRETIERLECGAFLAKAVLSTQKEGKGSSPLFSLLLCYLGEIAKAQDPHPFQASFILKLMRHDGLFAPEPFCTECKEMQEVLSLFGGESFCPRCAPPGSITLSLEETKTLLTLAYSRSIEEIHKTAISPEFLHKTASLFEAANSLAI